MLQYVLSHQVISKAPHPCAGSLAWTRRHAPLQSPGPLGLTFKRQHFPDIFKCLYFEDCFRKRALSSAGLCVL